MGQLDGKVAIVTGSGRGIGQQVALRLARDGAAVVVNDLDDAPAKETIALIEKLGGRAVACNGDVTAKDFGERIVDTAVKQLGGLHVIVNNAGYTWDNVIQKMTDEQWYAILDVHVTAPFRILRAFAPYLREQFEAESKRGQRIVRKVVQISSTSGVRGNAGQVNYSSAKAAVTGMTRTLAKEWGRYAVTVNCVAFGYIQTRLTKPLAEGEAGTIEVAGPHGEGRRAGQPHRGHEPDDPARPRRLPGGSGRRDLSLLQPGQRLRQRPDAGRHRRGVAAADMAMKLGVIFPQTECGTDIAAISEFVRAVEAMGADHLFVADHVLGADPRFHSHPSLATYSHEAVVHEALTLIAYLAAITRRLTLATGILILPQRQTALVAKQAAQIDVLSGGRLRLGIGVGWNAVEFEALNETFENRGRRSAEQIAVLRALWTQPVVDFRGEFHRISHAGLNPMPIQRPIPIWFGVGSREQPVPPDAALRRIARLADGWSPNFAPDDQGRALVDRVHQYARDAGRDPGHAAAGGTRSPRRSGPGRMGQAGERLEGARSDVDHRRAAECRPALSRRTSRRAAPIQGHAQGGIMTEPVTLQIFSDYV